MGHGLFWGVTRYAVPIVNKLCGRSNTVSVRPRPTRYDNPPTNFVVSRTFGSRIIGQHLSDADVTLTLEVTAARLSVMLWSSSSVCVPSLKLVGLLIRKILGIYWLSINRPGDPDLWPLNRFTGYSCDGLPSCQIWAFVSFSTYRPTPVTCITYVTLRLWRWRSRRLLLMRVFVLRRCQVWTSYSLPVRKILCYAQIVHLLCEH